jgi:hypothetical protein
MASPDETTAWALTTLAASIGGLIVGYWLGRMSREVHELREALMAEQDAHHATKARHGNGEPEIDRRSGDDRRQHGNGFPNLIVGILLVVLSVASISAGALSLARRNAAVDCQQAYNVAFSRALTERAQAAAFDRAAFTLLIRTTAQIQADAQNVALSDDRAVNALRARSTAALNRYLVTSQKADVARADNPIPNPRRC